MNPHQVRQIDSLGRAFASHWRKPGFRRLLMIDGYFVSQVDYIYIHSVSKTFILFD
jgi:hypothetical protein